MRKILFESNNYYHIYNRGVDKRSVFIDSYDLERFFQSMIEFNQIEPIGSIFENTFKLGGSSSKLVNIVAYCLNQNHYHLLIEPVVEKGIEKFMHRLSTGYTMYFNNKYKRTGALFQGRYKAKHIKTNKYLLHVSVYINLNNKAHVLGGSTSGLSKSSWEEYISNSYEAMCKKDIILNQFATKDQYRKFALSSLEDIILHKTADLEVEPPSDTLKK